MLPAFAAPGGENNPLRKGFWFVFSKTKPQALSLWPAAGLQSQHLLAQLSNHCLVACYLLVQRHLNVCVQWQVNIDP